MPSDRSSPSPEARRNLELKASPKHSVASDMRYFTVETWGEEIVAFIRSPEVFQSVEDVEAEIAAAASLNRRRDLRSRRLLIDSRQAPLSTTFEFAEGFARLRTEIRRGHKRMALLLGTKIGALQASRVIAEDGTNENTLVVDDEHAALAFLLDA